MCFSASNLIREFVNSLVSRILAKSFAYPLKSFSDILWCYQSGPCREGKDTSFCVDQDVPFNAVKLYVRRASWIGIVKLECRHNSITRGDATVSPTRSIFKLPCRFHRWASRSTKVLLNKGQPSISAVRIVHPDEGFVSFRGGVVGVVVLYLEVVDGELARGVARGAQRARVAPGALATGGPRRELHGPRHQLNSPATLPGSFRW